MTKFERIPVTISAVSKTFGLEAHKLVSPGRQSDDKYARARFAIMLILRNSLVIGGKKASYAKIGQILSGRDHSTIIHGINRARHLMSSDMGFAQCVISAQHIIIVKMRSV